MDGLGSARRLRGAGGRSEVRSPCEGWFPVPTVGVDADRHPRREPTEGPTTTTTSVPTDTYLFERRADLGDLESRRLHAIADLFDPAIRRLLAQVGVTRGWRCLEVAAGTGSVAAWLADEVGPEGEVFATDIDLTHLVRLPPNVTYAQHDIVTDSLPEGAFDVVHTRLLLEHLSGRETALNRMASAVRPRWVPRPRGGGDVTAGA